mmetsp:Transcript_71800/g.207996  ORF Transcript_71800/g.207996 Transcript_71800/m.207996 type:complete len:547 (+) Transcript_71800:65-1705(+)
MGVGRRFVVTALAVAISRPAGAQGPPLPESEVPEGLRQWIGRDNCGTDPWRHFYHGMAGVVQHLNQVEVAPALSALVALLAPVVQNPHLAFDCATAVSSAFVLAATSSEQLQLPVLAARLRQLGAIFGAFDYQMKGEEYIDQSPWPIQWMDSMEGILRSMAGLKLQEEQVEPSRALPVRSSLAGWSAPAPSKRIAIVSVCDYDAGATPLARLSQINKDSYARRHGYEAIVYEKAPVFDDGLISMLGEPISHRPAAWSKVDAVLTVMSRAEHDWVMWMDCDSFFMDPDVRLEDIIARAEEQQCGAEDVGADGDIAALRDLVKVWMQGPQGGVASGLGWYEGVLEEKDRRLGPTCGGPRQRLGDPPTNRTLGWDSWLFNQRRPELIASEDGLMLNTGIMLARSSTWSWRFFQHVRWMTFSRSPVTQHPWWEQTAMVYLLQMPFVLAHAGAAASATSPALVDISPASEYRGFAPACALFAQKHINGYPPLVSSALRTHVAFEPGDFIVSFSGCKVYSSQEVCNQLFLGYFFQVHDVRQFEADLALRSWL